MMKENEYGGVHLVVSVDCGGRTPFCAAARGAVCGGVKEKKKAPARKNENRLNIPVSYDKSFHPILNHSQLFIQIYIAQTLQTCVCFILFFLLGVPIHVNSC